MIENYGFQKKKEINKEEVLPLRGVTVKEKKKWGGGETKTLAEKKRESKQPTIPPPPHPSTIHSINCTSLY